MCCSALAADGFQGKAIVISRRGQLPRSHAPKGVVPQQVAIPHSKRVSLLVAAVRIACEMAEGGGTPWQAIINGLRPSVQNIWQALPSEEEVRFLRHLRPFWDAHRHRLPMDVHGRIRAEFNAGRAILLRGWVRDVMRMADKFAVKLRKRGAPNVGAAQSIASLRESEDGAERLAASLHCTPTGLTGAALGESNARW